VRITYLLYLDKVRSSVLGLDAYACLQLGVVHYSEGNCTLSICQYLVISELGPIILVIGIKTKDFFIHHVRDIGNGKRRGEVIGRLAAQL